MIPRLEGGQGLHCLVVDDSRVVRKAARRLLEGFGFAVREAEDGQQALDACRAALPDLVLLDWNMPVMDGMEFLQAARAEPPTPADIDVTKMRMATLTFDDIPAITEPNGSDAAAIPYGDDFFRTDV